MRVFLCTWCVQAPCCVCVYRNDKFEDVYFYCYQLQVSILFWIYTVENFCELCSHCLIYLYNFITVCRYIYIHFYQCVPIYLYNFIGVCQDHYFKRPRQGRADVHALATVCLSAFSLSRCSSVCNACWSVCMLACVPFYICSSKGTKLLEDIIKPSSIV